MIRLSAVQQARKMLFVRAPLAPPLGELPSASKAEGVPFVGWNQALNTTPPILPYIGDVKTGGRYYGNRDTPSAPVCALGQLPQRGAKGALNSNLPLC